MKTMKCFTIIGLVLAFILTTAACGDGSTGAKEVKFQKTESGLEYAFHKQNPDGKKPMESDFVTGTGIYKVGDTVFFDSRENPNPFSFPIMPETHKGDIFEGLKMMGEGDSATFRIPADSLFPKTFRSQQLPPFVQPGDMVYLSFRVDKVQSREDFEAEFQARMEAQNPDAAVAREQEIIEREAWLQENNITAEARPSGLIYIENIAGSGAQPQAGERVKVHYTGTLLDGTKFDSSVDRGEPFEFTLGQGQVIQGWDEGIALMKEGGKARLVIPSAIGYGSRDMGQIPPYSTLVFEVELIEVVK
jgi:FKBP-type peptidyl-prolyl cis-trans isomerase